MLPTARCCPNLLHGSETRVWGDQAYRGQRAVIREHAPRARDFTNRRYRHRGVVDEVERAKNHTKSKVRAKSLPSRKRGSNLPSGLSSRCSALPRCAIAGSKRTGIACSWPVRSAICSSRAAIYCAARWRNLPRSATTGCRRHRRHANNDTTAPTPSPIAAISMADIHSRPLVQTVPRVSGGPGPHSRH
jgi:hypothetical protein